MCLLEIQQHRHTQQRTQPPVVEVMQRNTTEDSDGWMDGWMRWLRQRGRRGMRGSSIIEAPRVVVSRSVLLCPMPLDGALEAAPTSASSSSSSKKERRLREEERARQELEPRPTSTIPCHPIHHPPSLALATHTRAHILNIQQHELVGLEAGVSEWRERCTAVER